MRIRILIFILAVICLAMGMQYFKREFGIGPGIPGIPDQAWKWFSLDLAVLPPATPVSEVVDTTVVPSVSPSVLTPEQQIGTILAVPVQLEAARISSRSATLEFVRTYQPTMVVLFGSDISASAAASVIGELKEMPRPPLIAVDHEGGSVQRLSGDGFTVQPSWRQFCNGGEEQFAQRAASIAAELRAVGVDVVLGPVVDLAASGSALRTRTCSSDPELVAERSSTYITAMLDAGITPVIKHYPGIGKSRVDLHQTSAAVALTSEDTRPFELMLEKWPNLPVMVSHVRVLPSAPDTPCLYSPICLGELRRVFPQSLIISDALEMDAAGYQPGTLELQPLPDRAEAALRNGVDLLLFGPDVGEAELREVTERLANEYVVNGKSAGFAKQSIDRTSPWRASISTGSAVRTSAP